MSDSAETKIALLEQSYKNMEKDVGEIKKTLGDFVEKADGRYVMRREFILAVSIIGTISGIVMPIIVFLLSKTRG